MATTTNPPRGLDSELTHIVTELFSNNHGIKSSLKANNINSRMDLHDALSKPELMKHVRWKNGDPKNGEVITSDVYRELILVPSFVNWLQNNHGTLPDCPIDFEHQVTRSKFTMFLLLDNHGRRGQHGDGTVSYDHTIAHESEKRHKRGAYAPSISASPAVVPIPAAASSVGSPASSATTSAGTNTAPTTTAGTNNNTTAAPQASITGNNPSSAVQRGNNNPPPTVQVPPTAPPQAVPTTAGTTSHPGSTHPSTRSDAAVELALFNKRIKASEDTWKKLESGSDWSTWKVKHLGKLSLMNSDDIVKAGSSPPDPTTSSPAEVELYRKKSTQLYICLMDAIQTSEGMTIVKRYADTLDGAATWKAIEAHYDTDMSAITRRTKYLFGLICQSTIPQNHRGLARAIDQFKNWIIEHNHYCKRGEEILGNTMLTHFERYIESIEKLKEVKRLINVQEDAILNSFPGSANAVNNLRTATAKIDFYYRQAQQMDAEFKTTVLNSRRKANYTMLDWDIDPFEYSPYEANVGMLEVPTDQLIADIEASYLVNAGAGRRDGFLPQVAFNQLSREAKKTWLTLPTATREMIMTCLDGDQKKPPPTGNENHRLPGVGIAGRNARVNQAEVDQTTHTPQPDETTETRLTHFSAIEAMRARSTAQESKNGEDNLQASAASSNRRNKSSMAPFVPARLMSSDNRSSTELVPITPSQRNVSMARSTYAADINVREALYDAAFPDILGNISIRSRSVSMAISSRVSSSRDVSFPSIGEPCLSHRGLVDGGANTGLANIHQLRLLQYAYPPRYINVNTAGDMNMQALRIGSFAAKATSKAGVTILLVFNEYGELRQGPSVHSKIQLIDGGCNVCDTPISLSGQQCVNIKEHVFPLVFDQGLPFIEMAYPSDEDLESLPRVNATNSLEWDPAKYDDASTNDIESIDAALHDDPIIPFTPTDDASLPELYYPSDGSVESAHSLNPFYERHHYCDDTLELLRQPNGRIVMREIVGSTRNMSERAIRGFQMGLRDSGANMGILRSTNPFEENLADDYTHIHPRSRFQPARYHNDDEQSDRGEFDPYDIEEAFIRSFYMNPQESSHYVD